MGGAQTKSQEKNLCLQLHNAISGGNEDVARELLLCGAVNPNNKLFIHSRKLDPPLFTAVENNCLSMVEVLLQYDAKISTFNREGFTPLHVAVAQNLMEIAETLIRHNADPSAPNAQGESSLHVAATYGLVNMTSLLLRSGASVNSRGKLNRTPLHSACAIPGNTGMAMSLLNHGADPDLQDEDQRTPLHYVAQLGNAQGIDILLQAGASKNTTDAHGKTPLHVSVENDEVAATRALLRHNCDVNVQDQNGQTPLHKATEKEFSELVSVLLQNGADPNVSNPTDVYPLRVAVWKKNPDIAKALIDAGAIVDATDRTGITALHVACLYAERNNDGDLVLVEQLINGGADVNAQCTKHRRSPLHNAVEGGNEEVVLLLLQHGASTSLIDSKGKTAASLSIIPSISDMISESDNNAGTSGTLTPSSARRLQSQTPSPGSLQRRMNHYTRPASGRPGQEDESARPVDGMPPPLPPRDGPPNGLTSPGVRSPFSVIPIPVSVPIIRHHFKWTVRDPETSETSEAQNNQNHFSGMNVGKLSSFATNCSSSKRDAQVLCYSVTPSKQTINTHLGCVLEIEQSSATTNFLLYVEAQSYSRDILPLPSGHFLCSNVINFYTHVEPNCRGSVNRDEKPEREVPHFEKLIILRFVLRHSAMEKYDPQEHEFKVFVSCDEGCVWDELMSRLDEVQVDQTENASFHGKLAKTINFVTVETYELGIFAVVLCPRQDVKRVKSDGVKVVSSVEPATSASLCINHSESYTIEMEALKVPSQTIEQLSRAEFSYFVGCSREVRISVKSEETTSSRVSMAVHLPCSTTLRTSQADVTYRILMKREEVTRGMPFCTDDGDWEDITDAECQQLNICTKGKRLLGQASSDSVHHISFCVAIDPPIYTSFLVVAVRSFTSTLSRHLKSLPKAIARLRNSSSVCFVVNQKSSRASNITCDIVPASDASQLHQRYSRNGCHFGPRPSTAQVVEERDCIIITAVGGVRLQQKSESNRRLVFHSALQPSVEYFKIKGTSCSSNTSSKYSGSIEFSIDTKAGNSSAARARSPLNSESSVLVMENSLTAASNSSSNAAKASGQKVLASLPVELPRKTKSSKTKPLSTQPTPDIAAMAAEKSFLSDVVMQRICKALDEPELRELSFQLGIAKNKVTEAFTEHVDNAEAAGLYMLKQWRLENAVKNDIVTDMSLALRCIGRENLSQDVARRCNPFLENSAELPPLPAFTRNVDAASSAVGEDQ